MGNRIELYGRVAIVSAVMTLFYLHPEEFLKGMIGKVLYGLLFLWLVIWLLNSKEYKELFLSQNTAKERKC